MEGLIPLVYKTIKRSRTRRRYECLSFGAADNYNIENFYPNGFVNSKQYEVTPSDKVAAGGGLQAQNNRHRRTQSFHVEYTGGVSPEIGSTPAKDKELVRFKGHRRMFSCVTGGW
ncbi:PREDICTED: uncharacterized protein LOC109208443 [Nicotiana attenuata]|uniref:Uncharacterized protein n=1 Tax=Nicotiana attenuata TaxID=49451 RepID=A0A314KQK1_NICAT|nr:PREDICTED: uncharacterized protein LOC109208443 [Nicotiana attenuata]OIT31636.1 hypothetical protein A4A49_10476 [Nicotiana attenuata]